MRKANLQPDSDALFVRPIRPAALSAVLDVRREVLVLVDYQLELSKLHLCRAGDVLAVTADCFEATHQTLKKLVVNASWGENPDPMSRDGNANRLMQKLLRELKVIPLLVETIQLPCRQGADINLIGKDPEYEPILTLLNLLYRLLKMMAKNDLVNSRALHKHVPVFRQQLGKGILISPTLREIFVNKRELLRSIDYGLMNQFVELLMQDLAPQYIDFIMSVCVCSDSMGEIEPVASVQALVIRALCIHGDKLLPEIKYAPDVGGAMTCFMHVPGTVDILQGGDPLWLNLADFQKLTDVRGRKQDFVGWIMNSPLTGLDPPQRSMRIFIRCLELYVTLVYGRNQEALQWLLTNRKLGLDYHSIMKILRNNSIPFLVRARYYNLLKRLFVDRHPQTTIPAIVYTRKWSEVQVEPSTLDIDEEGEVNSRIPVCSDGFQEVVTFLMRELPKVADCKDCQGRPSLNGTPNLGQLEMIKAMLSLCDLLLSFGCFSPEQIRVCAKNELSITESNERITALFECIFTILEARIDEADDAKTGGRLGDASIKTRRAEALLAKRRSDKSVEARMLHDVRCDALDLLQILFDKRLNIRLTKCQETWEAVFQKMDKSPKWMSLLSRATQKTHQRSHTSMESGPDIMIEEFDPDSLKVLFSSEDQKLKDLVDALFHTNLVSTPAIKSDTCTPRHFFMTQPFK